jgi:hypothetical protein
MKNTSKTPIVLRPWHITTAILAALLIATLVTTTISNAIGSETFLSQLSSYHTYLPLVFQEP